MNRAITILSLLLFSINLYGQDAKRGTFRIKKPKHVSCISNLEGTTWNFEISFANTDFNVTFLNSNQISSTKKYLSNSAYDKWLIKDDMLFLIIDKVHYEGKCTGLNIMQGTAIYKMGNADPVYIDGDRDDVKEEWTWKATPIYDIGN